ncbi:MAG: YceD family protein [Actinomycetota bacterium]
MALEGLSALREGTQLSVEVSELLRDPGTSKRLEFTEEVAGLSLDMGRAGPMLSFDLLLESLVEGILVGGTIRGSFRLECSRCLSEFAAPFTVELSEVMAYQGQPGGEEGYEITGDHAHIEPVVRDAVLLAMPSNPLHAPDCKGLCPECGADRNLVDCGHEPRRADLRWEPLGTLKERLAEPGRTPYER